MSPLVGEIKRGWGTLKSYSPQTWRLRSSTRRVSTPRRRQAQGNARVGARGARFLILELIRRSVYTVAVASRQKLCEFWRDIDIGREVHSFLVIALQLKHLIYQLLSFCRLYLSYPKMRSRNYQIVKYALNDSVSSYLIRQKIFI